MTLDEILLVLEDIAKLYFMVSLIMLVLVLIARWQLFEKAYEDGWKSIVPILSSWTLFKIAGMNPWLIFLMVVPGVNLVLGCIFAFKFSRTFGFKLLGSLAYILFPGFVILYIGFSKKIGYRVPV
jgi:hypothetical protein